MYLLKNYDSYFRTVRASSTLTRSFAARQGLISSSAICGKRSKRSGEQRTCRGSRQSFSGRPALRSGKRQRLPPYRRICASAVKNASGSWAVRPLCMKTIKLVSTLRSARAVCSAHRFVRPERLYQELKQNNLSMCRETVSPEGRLGPGEVLPEGI